MCKMIKFTVALLTFFFMFIMQGCEPPKYQNVEDHVRVMIVAQVPFAGYGGESQFLETDAQGRELWSYKTNRFLVYLIFQKHDHEQIYFYEDFCFTISKPEIGFSDNEISQFKTTNDWNQTLALEKANLRALHWPSEALDYDQVTAKALIGSAVSVQGKYVISFDPFDYDCNGKHLWLIHASTKEKPKFEETVFYFAIITKDDNKESISSLLAVDDLYAYQTALHEFKEENGWVFS